MPNLSDPLTICFAYLLAGAWIAYFGVQVLWNGLRGCDRLRGIMLAVPVVGVALTLASMGFGGLGIALLCTAAMMMLTLGLGVTACNASAIDGIAHPSLRLLLPVAGCTFIVGFGNELSLVHAAAIAVIAGLVAWSMSPSTSPDADDPPIDRSSRRLATVGLAVVLIGAALATTGTRFWLVHVSNVITTPIVVMLVPALLLSVLLMLAGDARRSGGGGAIRSIVSFVVTCLGCQALVIVLSHILHARLPVDAEAGPIPAVVMLPATWRVDGVLLLVVTALLIPAGAGSLRLGRLEGLALMVLYAFYALAAMHAGIR